MDDNTPEEGFSEFKNGQLGLCGVAQIAAGTGLAVYAMWVGILQPGFRKVPLKLQVRVTCPKHITISSVGKKCISFFFRSHTFLQANFK